MSVFIHIETRTNYHDKNFALRIALKERLRGAIGLLRAYLSNTLSTPPDLLMVSTFGAKFATFCAYTEKKNQSSYALARKERGKFSALSSRCLSFKSRACLYFCPLVCVSPKLATTSSHFTLWFVLFISGFSSGRLPNSTKRRKE